MFWKIYYIMYVSLRLLMKKKTMSRAAKNLQWGLMRPAGRQFEIPDIENESKGNCTN